jgi:hypothetical protein
MQGARCNVARPRPNEEDAMTDTRRISPNRLSEGARKAVCGVAAAVATAATLGIAVLAPAVAAHTTPSLQALVQTKRLVLGPAEIALVPSRIEVIAIRAPHTDPAIPAGAPARGLIAAYQPPT